MTTNVLTDLETLAAHVSDGCVIALPHALSADFSAASMVTTRVLVRRQIKDLHLIGVPALSFQADLLIGAGCVAIVESGSILLYEYGPACRFVAAQKGGNLRVKDSTCPAIHAGLLASEKGLPFMPVRGLLGSDVLRYRMEQDGWRVIDNPFADSDPIVLVPALRPDIALFHAPLADRFGNVWVGRRTELATMARSARKALVTVESVFDGNLTDDAELAPATIPAFCITALSHQPKGSWPLNGVNYDEDRAHLREYARLAATDEGFAQYLERFVQKQPSTA